MNSLLKWSITNAPAVNTIAVVILVIGGWSAYSMQREFWPHAELDVIDVWVDYPGAAPDEVESAICEKVEEATRNIAGVRRVTSVARTGRGTVSIQLQNEVRSVEADEIVNQVRGRVDQIVTFPADAERPVVQRRPQRTTSIQLGIVGRNDESVAHQQQLRTLSEQIRQEVLTLPSVSNAVLVGAPKFQIDVELSEGTLRAHGVSLQQAAARIREFSEEVAGGVLRTENREVLLRGERRGLRGVDLESIPLVSSSAGAQRTVGQLGSVRDAFAEETSISRLNGRPGLALRIDAGESDDILQVGRQIHDYVNARSMPEGFELVTFLDRTDDVESRLNLLTRNGWQGLLLVFLLLSLLLDFRLAIWVAAGIPLALAGAAAVMYFTGQSLNMSSMFAFLIAIGIVVDDAIIVGENIFTHRQLGKTNIRAAMDGCREVMPAVVTSVLTTSIAFLPILLMTGRAGRMTQVLPLAIISVLLFSLAEALLVLPCHLARNRSGRGGGMRRLFSPPALLVRPLNWLSETMQAGLRRLIVGFYRPALCCCVRNAPLTIAFSMAALIVTLAAVGKGRVPFSLLPKMDWNFCTVLVKFPDGTSKEVTNAATAQLESALRDVSRELIINEGADPVRVVYRTVGFGTDTSGELERGSHVGSLTIQLVDSAERQVTSQDLIRLWRDRVRDIGQTSTLQFAAGPIGIDSAPIEFKLLANKSNAQQLEQAAQFCVASMEQMHGVHDVATDRAIGKQQYRVRLHENAGSAGVTMGQVANAIRAAVHGEEAIRLQRGRHEVPIRVRYAKADRNSLRDLHQVTVRTADGSQLPIREFAKLEVTRGVSAIHRRDQKRSITITADVDSATNSRRVSRALQREVVDDLVRTFPGVQVVWDGQRAETKESMERMRYGFVAVLLGMYVLLTIQFRSYMQPLLILVIVPFSMIGAVAGHYLLGLSLTLFSIYGMVALAGIVVNDSIVLIDFINKRLPSSPSVESAIIDAGCCRFRPILLTSITTVVCLLPVMSETSRQAQVLAPMAVSVAFGLVASTFFVLLLVPAIYASFQCVREPEMEP